MIKRRGIVYDVGLEMGGNWRPDYSPDVVHRELEIIKNDLHCNAVRIFGKDIGRVMATAEDALGQGLEVWLSPVLWNKSPKRTLDYTVEAAKAAQPLHERYPDKVVFSVGTELTVFMRGIMPGRTITKRMRNVLGTNFVKSGKHNKTLNDYLAQANAAVRKVFDGRVTYASLVFEKVDWSIFDFVSVDHYWSEEIKSRYIDMVKPLFRYGKPVVNTEFGFITTNTPVTGAAISFGNVNDFSRVLHRLPVIGRFIKPWLTVVNERDEAAQARRLVDTLKLVDEAGFNGAFVSTFIFSLNPYSDMPKYDLDRESASLVKYYDDGRHGTTYTDMAWEPKEAFRALAKYYGGQREV